MERSSRICILDQDYESTAYRFRHKNCLWEVNHFIHLKQTNMDNNVTYHETVEVGYGPVHRKRKRVSWGAIIGGVITVLATLILLSFIGMAIGLWAFDPTDSQPTHGMGVGLIIWWIISWLAALAAGGWVAGKLAGFDGMIHGFLTWATTLLLSALLMGMFLSGVAKLAGNIFGSVTSMAGQVLSGPSSPMRGERSMMGRELRNLFGDIDLDGERDEIRPEVRQSLRRSGVREFQPEYVQRQMRAVQNDYQRTVKRSVANPHRAEQHIDGFLQRTNERAEKVFRVVDREAVRKAIADNPRLTQAEAEDLVDYYVVAAQEGRENLHQMRQNVEQARQEWSSRKAELRQDAEKAANRAAWNMIWFFFALLVGAAVSAVMGMFGTRMTREGMEA